MKEHQKENLHFIEPSDLKLIPEKVDYFFSDKVIQ